MRRKGLSAEAVLQAARLPKCRSVALDDRRGQARRDGRCPPRRGERFPTRRRSAGRRKRLEINRSHFEPEILPLLVYKKVSKKGFFCSYCQQVWNEPSPQRLHEVRNRLD